MSKIDKVRAEIERLMDGYKPIVGGVDELTGAHIVLTRLLAFIDTLEESERPEPYNPVYDEAHLNEKIKKATESWKGVDVDAMLAECRGYDEEKSEEPDKDLEKEVEDYFQGMWPGTETPEQCNTDLHFTPPAILRLARHFAEWQNERMAKSMPLPEDTVLFQKGVAEGRRLEREDMTWQDCKRIVEIADAMLPLGGSKLEYFDFNSKYQTKQAYYEDVLRKFKEDEK